MSKQIKITPELQELLKSRQPSAQISEKTGLSLSWVQKYRQAYRNIPEKNNFKAQAILGRFTESERIKDYAAEIGAGNPITVRQGTPEELAEFMHIKPLKTNIYAERGDTLR